jgi:hypothetical protein
VPSSPIQIAIDLTLKSSPLVSNLPFGHHELQEQLSALHALLENFLPLLVITSIA